MPESMRAVRIAKVVALLAFALPWLTVSCSGQKIASISGWNLVTGSISLRNPVSGAVEQHGGSPSVLIILALIAIVGGIVLSFKNAELSNKAKATLGFSISATVLIWLGTSSINGGSAMRAASERQTGYGQDMFAASIVSVDYAIGFWVTTLCLALATFLSWSILNGNELIGRAMAPPTPPGANPSPATSNTSICPQCSRRYPAGASFCTADGTRLVANEARFCSNCGASLAVESQFCQECGTSTSDGGA